MKEKRETKKSPKLKELIEAAEAEGVKVKVSMGPIERMPQRLPNDPPAVTMLLDEAERVNALAQKWEEAKPSNPLAVQANYKLGYTFAVAGAWLRCKLKGELLPESEEKKKYTEEIHTFKYDHDKKVWVKEEEENSLKHNPPDPPSCERKKKG